MLIDLYIAGWPIIESECFIRFVRIIIYAAPIMSTANIVVSQIIHRHDFFFRKDLVSV